MKRPLQGEVWFVDLDPVIGHEEAKKRPCVVISNNKFNLGDSELVFAVPMTSKNKYNPLHIKISPPEGGLIVPSYIMPEHAKSLSIQRFASQKMGTVSAVTMATLRYMLKILLDFE